MNKSIYDKFYTKDAIAYSCISKLNLNEYDVIIEPSVGGGAFYNQINHPKKIGIDLKPTGELRDDFNIRFLDFLQVDITEFVNKKVLVIGNPPYGKVGSTALKFINKASEFSETIAFILPKSFSKDHFKNKINLNFHLDYEEFLPLDSFVFGQEDFKLDTVFQIWNKKEYKRVKTKKEEPLNFSYVKTGEYHFNIRRVGFKSGFASLDKNIPETGNYYKIKLSENVNLNHINLILNKINEVKWEYKNSSIRNVSQSQINPILNSIIKDSFL